MSNTQSKKILILTGVILFISMLMEKNTGSGVQGVKPLSDILKEPAHKAGNPFFQDSITYSQLMGVAGSKKNYVVTSLKEPPTIIYPPADNTDVGSKKKIFNTF